MIAQYSKQNMIKFSIQPCWIGAKIQITLTSCIVKWFYETELQVIYLYKKYVAKQEYFANMANSALNKDLNARHFGMQDICMQDFWMQEFWIQNFLKHKEKGYVWKNSILGK